MENDFDRPLFDDEDIKAINTFYALSEDAQKLYVRLYQRQYRWVRRDKIHYPKIAEDLNPQLEELVKSGLFISETQLFDLETIFRIMSGPDLRSLAKTLRLNTNSLHKDQIIRDILKHGQQTSIGAMFQGRTGGSENMILKRAKGMVGSCYKLEPDQRQVFIRVMMLFDLTKTRGDDDQGAGGQQQLFQMLMVNMGKVKYPEYTLNRRTTIFTSRQEVIEFSKALQLEADILEAIVKKDYVAAGTVYKAARVAWDAEMNSHTPSLPDFLCHYTAGAVYTRVLSYAVEVLQFQKDYQGAVDLLKTLLHQTSYCQDYRGRWYDRLALNLDFHLKQPEKALDTIRESLLDSEVRVGPRLALYQRAVKICTSPSNKKLKKSHWQFFESDLFAAIQEAPKITIQGKQIQSPTGPNWIYLDPDTEDTVVCGVEQLALLHYQEQGYSDGIHGETGTFSFLFALYLWDIIFMDGVDDTFHNPFQGHPLDIYSKLFYSSRQTEFDERLDVIRNGSEEDLMHMLSASWTEHENTMCYGVSWERFSSLDQAKGFVRCIGGPALAGIFSRMAQDQRFCHSGMPDLAVWNQETKTFKIVEVKGPNDRLSTKQILWLDYLMSLGLDAEVCLVSATGGRKFRS